MSAASATMRSPSFARLERMGPIVPRGARADHTASGGSGNPDKPDTGVVLADGILAIPGEAPGICSAAERRSRRYLKTARVLTVSSGLHPVGHAGPAGGPFLARMIARST